MTVGCRAGCAGVALLCGVLYSPPGRGQDLNVWQMPHTEWGDPDLEGTWLGVNALRLPFQRPVDEGDAALLYELVDSGALEAGLLNEGVPEEPRRIHREVEIGEWRRTHFLSAFLVVDPADGRLPPLTATARDRAARAWRSTILTKGPWDGPADFGPVERCISRGALRSMLPAFDYNGVHIVQAPGVVVIRTEAIHEARVIPLDDRPPLAPAIRSWMGDARGSWDGHVLVVESTNFNGRAGAHLDGNEMPMSDQLRLVERFTRMDRDTLQYEVTVEDPGTWIASWKAAFAMTWSDEYVMAEYACHEGNYALRHVLSAARAAERER